MLVMPSMDGEETAMVPGLSERDCMATELRRRDLLRAADRDRAVPLDAGHAGIVTNPLTRCLGAILVAAGMRLAGASGIAARSSAPDVTAPAVVEAGH